MKVRGALSSEMDKLLATEDPYDDLGLAETAVANLAGKKCSITAVLEGEMFPENMKVQVRQIVEFAAEKLHS